MIGTDRNITLSKESPSANSTISSSIAEINGQVFPGEKTEKFEKVNLEEKTSRRDPGSGYFNYIYQEVNASTLAVDLKELKHFSSYTISVRACREPEPHDDKLNCSTEVIAYQRTGKIGK